MSARRTFATSRRVLAQLRHDPRTVVLLLLVPCILITILRYVFEDQPDTFGRIGAPVLVLFPFTVMFVVTSIATLRERSSGTLERLLTMPTGKLDLIAGYALAFGLLAVAQGVLAASLTLGPLGLSVQADAFWLIVVVVATGLLGMALGLFVSAFAATEFQAVQFLPVVVLPQVLICGLLVPRSQMAGWLDVLSRVLPLSYAVQAMTHVTTGDLDGVFVKDLLLIAGSAVVALGLGALTLRRRTA